MSKVADQKSGTDKRLPASGGPFCATTPQPGDSLLLPAVFVAGYAPCFLVDRRFLKATHRTKQEAAMRKRIKKAFL